MPFAIISSNFFFDFISIRKYAYYISLFLFCLGLAAIPYRGGIPLGVDFAGGSLVQITFATPITAEKVRTALEKENFKEFSIQSIGDSNAEYLIRLSFAPSDPTVYLQDALDQAFLSIVPSVKYTIDRTETVGAKVSEDTSDNALKALYYAILVIAIYISGRFEARWVVPLVLAGSLSALFFLFTNFSLSLTYLVPIVLLITIFVFIKFKLSFALGAILSLIHDILITAGLLIFFGVSFNLSIVAALLAIIGYSLNDTIIVYDRIRELLLQQEQRQTHIPLKELLNRSICTTLSRTILTSATTLFVLLSLLLFGGSILYPFALTLFIGVIVGTLSSIFIASPILLSFGIEHLELEKTKIMIDENGVV